MKKRILSMLLVVCMIMSMAPAVFAEESTDNTAIELYYDDYLDAEIIEPGQDTQNDANAVLTEQNGKVHAVGLGVAKVKIDNVEYTVTVSPAPVEIMLVMGQSNACELFCTEYAQIECAKGTAYKWGASNTNPTTLTKTKGWHSALAAEWYAQSGIKPVLVYENNVTTQNGSPLAGRASNNTIGWISNEGVLTSASNTAINMVNNAYNYFNTSAYYTVNGCGMYWYQGEGDATKAIDYYYNLFSSLWTQLKAATELSYCGFFRLRDGTPLDYVNSAKAQYQLANDNSDIYIASNITESWTAPNEYDPVTIETKNFKTISRKVDGTVITKVDGTKITTTMHYLWGWSKHNTKHGCQLGYNLMGADAAYNMYSALYGTKNYAVELMQGKIGAASHVTRVATKSGSMGNTIFLSDLTEDIVFYLAPGSGAGELKLSVTADGADVTNSVMVNSLNGLLSLSKLKNYSKISVLAEVVKGETTVAKTTYNFTSNYSGATSYRWDFNDNTLNAYDANGKIANAFEVEALTGKYVFNKGILSAEDITYGVQLKLVEPIVLDHTKDWSIEWRLTSYGNGGNLFSTHETTTGAANEWMLLNSRDRAGLANIRKTNITYHYGAAAKAGESLDGQHGDVLLLINNYDEATGKNTISLYKNSQCWIEDFSKTGDYNGQRAYTEDEWANEYITGTDFVFNYLGARKAGNVDRLFRAKIDYIEVKLDGAHVHSFSDVWSYDASSHWCACTVDGCTEVSGKTAHSGYVNYGIGVCSVCGYDPEFTTQYSGATSYRWDFNDNTLNAYDKNGEVANAFEVEALTGKYVFNNGILSAEDITYGVQLKLVEPIVLDHTKDWSIEWCLTSYGNGGPLFSSHQTTTGAINEWMILHSRDRASLANFRNSAEAYFYGASGKAGKSLDGQHGDVLLIINNYDEATGKNTISLYKNGQLWIEDFSKTGDYNGQRAYTDAEWTKEYITGTDIVFNYLGAQGSGSANRLFKARIDYIEVRLEEEHIHVPSTEWSYDADYHWHECTAGSCTEDCDKVEHDDPTGLCTVCGNLNYSGATSYTWDFNNSLYAYDANGKIANSFNSTPVSGTAVYSNGILSSVENGGKIQLALDIPIELDHTKNWSIEYKVSAFKNGGGLFASDKGQTKGAWVMLNTTSRASFTYYTSNSAVINFGAHNVNGAKPNGKSNDIIKYVNTYDPETGKNTISLYENGKLKVENIIVEGDSSGKALTDTQKANSQLNGADIVFKYLGNSQYMMAAQIDYIKVDVGN